MSENLAADLGVSVTRARFAGVGDDENRIPGAMNHVVAAGASWEPTGDGPFAALRLRRFGSYALTEDNSMRADPSTLLNLNAGYRIRGVRLGLAVLNLLDAQGSDVEYFYTSRLATEPLTGYDDVHFHPVEPRQLRLSVTIGG
jgi:hypothetical protein